MRESIRNQQRRKPIRDPAEEGSRDKRINKGSAEEGIDFGSTEVGINKGSAEGINRRSTEGINKGSTEEGINSNQKRFESIGNQQII